MIKAHIIFQSVTFPTLGGDGSLNKSYPYQVKSVVLHKGGGGSSEDGHFKVINRYKGKYWKQDDSRVKGAFTWEQVSYEARKDVCMVLCCKNVLDQNMKNKEGNFHLLKVALHYFRAKSLYHCQD